MQVNVVCTEQVSSWFFSFGVRQTNYDNSTPIGDQNEQLSKRSRARALHSSTHIHTTTLAVVASARCSQRNRCRAHYPVTPAGQAAQPQSANSGLAGKAGRDDGDGGRRARKQHRSVRG